MCLHLAQKRIREAKQAALRAHKAQLEADDARKVRERKSVQVKEAEKRKQREEIRRQEEVCHAHCPGTALTCQDRNGGRVAYPNATHARRADRSQQYAEKVAAREAKQEEMRAARAVIEQDAARKNQAQREFKMKALAKRQAAIKKAEQEKERRRLRDRETKQLQTKMLE